MRSSRTTRSDRLGGVTVVAGLALLLVACTGDEPVRSPLTVEDLGPGEWVGPLADTEGLDGRGRIQTCTMFGGIYDTSGHDLLDEQLAYFGEGETQVEVRAERYAPGDPDLAARLASVDRLDRCVVDEANPGGEMARASWEQTDGVVVYDALTDRTDETALDFEFRIAMTTTDEWFVAVEVSNEEGTSAPDAVELLERAVANVEALPTPEVDEG